MFYDQRHYTVHVKERLKYRQNFLAWNEMLLMFKHYFSYLIVKSVYVRRVW